MSGLTFSLQLLCDEWDGAFTLHLQCGEWAALDMSAQTFSIFPTVFTLQLQCDERAKLNASASLSQIGTGMLLVLLA
jgi:hypothetical protein